jgi:hypothetical protein
MPSQDTRSNENWSSFLIRMSPGVLGVNERPIPCCAVVEDFPTDI